MRSRIPKTLIGSFLIVIMLFTSVSFGVLGAPRHAQANNPAATAAGLAIDAVIVGLQAAIAADQPIAGGQAGSAAAKTAEKTGEKVIDPIFVTVVREVFMNMLSFTANRLAYDAAVALASAGTGQTPLVEFESAEAYFTNLGFDVLGETIESLDDALSDALDTEFELCAPQDPISRVSLQIGLRNAYSRQSVRPRCDFQDFLNNREALFGRFSGQAGSSENILRRFSKAYNPGQNELDASIALNLGVHQQISLKKELGIEERFANEGFKDVVDVITGQTKTPAALIRKQSETAIILAKNEYTKDLALSVLNDQEALKQMGLSAISVFANTLLSNLSNNIFSGLFNPPDIRGIDPFNPQSIAQGGRERAQETFRGILSAPIISFDDYNITNEFVICPGDDLRGINNCVMDQSFATALSRSKTDAPLTVQQAIDEGFLHGDWPLIPETDVGRNQDPRCHTYGYCYANLVKMRKARLIPVGWELAANSVFNGEASPVTLQQAIDGFFTCNDQGQADDSNPWCHLIDPNWILKTPAAQCRAFVPGEIPVSGLVNARQSVCVDAPTCIDENDDGECIGGYGYCSQETNVWQFRGDTCPAEFAGCLAFSNVRSGETGEYLLNTVDADGCTADNPGCRWYRTNKFFDSKGTDDLSDDTFEFLATSDDYVVADRDDDIETATSTPTSYAYGATSSGNLFDNPSFEVDADGDGNADDWGIGPGSEAPISTAEAYTGSNSANRSPFIITAQQQPLDAGTTYELSGWVKASTNGEIAGILVMSTILHPASPLAADISGSCTTPAGPFSSLNVPLTWTKLSCTFTSNLSQTGTFLVTGTPNVFFDEVSLVPVGANSYELYAYEDRIYLDQDAGTCSEEVAGCTELIAADGVNLNMLRNPGFEEDEDQDSIPDQWNDTVFTPGYDIAGGGSFEGLASLTTEGVSTAFGVEQADILLQPNRFYTFSMYAKTDVGTTGATRSAQLSFEPASGTSVIDLGGTTILGDCTEGPSPVDLLTISMDPTVGEGYERYTCTFTTPSEPTLLSVAVVDNAGLVSGGTDETYYDGLQLELGSLPSAYQEGYGNGLITREYLTLPPAWLGCTGAANDPAECANYTQVCTAQDVGCDLYTPTAGGFGVPAVTSAADTCPNECVGYETYKQEATPYESERFPLFFIADSANVCTQAQVGCDSYTNLNEVAAGGEGIEYYSTLRFCAQPDQDEGSTYYTWEGTAEEGFQLRAWQLLESNLSDSLQTTYIEGATTVFTENNVGLAPCTNPVVTSEDTIACDDDIRLATETDTFVDCNEHGDIFTNPDCREFYDSDGDIHYRELSQTAIISEACTPYRKDAVAGSGEDLDANGIDDGQENCENSGGFWTAGGACRYFVLADESQSCSAAAAGCREYTGASGRNASTIFEDTIEDGSLSEYDGTNPGVTISNESLAAGGHSIRVTSGNLNVLSLVEGTATITSGDTDLNGQCDDGEVCTLEDAGGSSCEIVGTDTNNVDDCGPLVGRLAQGKTYVLEFWAKGTGIIISGLVADRGVSGATVYPMGSTTLTGSWQRYSVGPLDTSDIGTFSDFDDTAIVRFAGGSADYFIDNISLRETEENLTLIKDSWVTPSTCDASPTGVPSPQHYLGCQEYTNTAGDTENLYQFTRLCQEEVIGCSAYFDTQNSEEVFGQVFNATCSRPIGSVPPSGSEACTMDGETVCTIAAGRSSCHFDVDGALPNPLPGSPFEISLGPEARVVSNDTDVFLVNKENTSCGAAVAGCMEVGLPTFSQDKTQVTGFESQFIIDDPDQYSAILCDTEGLFCEAWNTTADGTFYFKDPANQTCDFKNSVTINNQEYSGWFRTGTSDPCYYDDLNENGSFDIATELSTAYLLSGVEFGIWRNGDLDPGQYDGWLATCPTRYDRCSEFIDVLDTGNGAYPNGTPYVYIKNEKIDETQQVSGQRCDGQVSLNEGCALFFDAVQPELQWNASASYIASEHADILYGDAAQSKQSPISCFGSELFLTGNPYFGNDVGQVTAPSGVVYNLCQSRCRYDLQADGLIEHPYAEYSAISQVYTGSCLLDNDCPNIVDTNNKTLSGSCVQGYDSSPTGFQPTWDPNMRVENLSLEFDDVNDIRNVSRDRQCSEWLTCSSTIQVWDERLGRFREICDQIGSCIEYSTTGDTTICSRFSTATATPLSMSSYIDRDVSWWGPDYAGYTIPGNIPTQFLDQVNVNPPFWCSNDHDVTCTVATEETDCGVGNTCEESVEDDMRLAYNAGLCDSSELDAGESCYIGQCQNSGFACSGDLDCDTDSSEQCVIGFCEFTGIGASCGTSLDCSTAGFPGYQCINNQCKLPTTATCSPNNSLDCLAALPNTVGQCILEETAFEGGCYASQCLLAANGEPFVRGFTNATECKAYPEQNSPYPHQVGGADDGELTNTGIVTQWTDPSSPGSTLSPEDLATTLASATPEDAEDWGVFTKRPGLQGIEACAPNGEDCSCTYQKVTYGNGIKTRYYGRDIPETVFVDGLCSGGEVEGLSCTTDAHCNPGGGVTGRCVKRTSVETHLGVDGYCLERDSALNKWSDPDATFGGECLTWLPVDQLTGSNDIYNTYTEAGAILDETGLYCTNVDVFTDVYATGSQDHGLTSGYIELSDDELNCAESLHEPPAASGGLECDLGEYRECWKNAHCPQNFFAILGTCESTGGSVCRAAAFQDDDCPYFCVPEGAFDPFEADPDDAIARCAPPTSATLESSEFGGFVQEPDWTTDVYLVESLDSNGLDPEFASSWSDRYGRCVKRGIPVGLPDAHPDHWDDSYGELRNATHGWDRQGTGEAREFYLGCTEVAVTSDPTTVYGGPGNKAWTDRLWEGQPAPYILNGALDYTALTEPDTPGGRVTIGDLETSTGFQFIDAIAGDDQFPFPVAACEVDNLLYVADEDPAAGLTCTSLGGTVTDYIPAGLTDFYGRAYTETVAVTSGAAPTLPTCTDWTTCNAGFSCDETTPANQFCYVECNPNVSGTCDFDTDGDGTDDEFLGTCQLSESTGGYFCSGHWPGECSANGWTSSEIPNQTNLGTCVGGGDYDGELCEDNGVNDYDCWPLACQQINGQGYCTDEYIAADDPYIDSASVTTSTASFNLRLSQFFAKYFKIFSYDHDGGTDGGIYEELSGFGPVDFSEDPSGIPGSEASDGTAPVVRGLDDCFGAGCREGSDDTISVNGVDTGTIFDANGTAHASVQFFVEANANQLPVRNIIVNWGDGTDPSGSTSDGNYYKNRRGILPNETILNYCDNGDDWGEQPTACDPSYVTFTHDYICSEAIANGLPLCTDSAADLSDGCQNAAGNCEFIPRVFVKDNWGYCAGSCGDSGDVGGSACYDDSSGFSGKNECDVVCDSYEPDSSCFAGIGQSNAIDPWIYFDGAIEIEP